jgi:DNA-binding PadR family transcriptional regulator
MFKENGSDDFAGFNGRGRGRGLGRGRRWLGDYSLMDIRLVEPALLIFLDQDGLHGYGLLEKLAGIGLTEINPSMIYRILRDYEELGLVQSEWDADTTQGPPKRVYTITSEGRLALEQAATSLRVTAQRIETMLDLFDLSESQE